MPQRLANPKLLWAIAAFIGGTAIFVAGFIASAALNDDRGEPEATAPTATSTRAASRTPARTPSRTPTVAPTTFATPFPETQPPAPVSEPPTPTFTPTPDFTKQPEVEVLSVDPPLGTHIELATVDIAINVRYQAGRDSNVLAWELTYCAGPYDCNTYGSRHETGIVPGSSGTVTIGAPFPAGGNYLRPIVVCKYRVTIGKYLTPEAEWQSGVAPDERCQGEQRDSVRINGVSPDLGTNLSDGQSAAVNIEYSSFGADQLLVEIYTGPQCVLSGARTIDIAPNNTGVVTVDVALSPPLTGTLRSVEATLLSGGSFRADYSFGSC
jgi:hypothetical protein